MYSPCLFLCSAIGGEVVSTCKGQPASRVTKVFKSFSVLSAYVLWLSFVIKLRTTLVEGVL